MQPAATEFLRGKGFEKGGPVSQDAMNLAVMSPEATRLRKAITNEQRIKN